MTKRKNTGPLFFKPERSSKTKTPQGDVTVVIDKLSGEGRGMAFHNGKPLFIPNTLPGENVRAAITLEKREYAEGQLRDIIRAADERIAPRCELFGRCGGCDLQMLDYSAQLEHKSQTLTRLLKKYIDGLSEPIVASPWHYRHRARFTIGENNGKPVLGFKAANSHRVIAIAACTILDERLQPLLAKIPLWLEALENWRRIDEIRLAIDSHGKIALSWDAKRALSANDEDLLIEFCEAEQILCEEDAKLEYRVPSQNTTFDFSLDDFTQVNPAINDQLVARALAWLQPPRNENIGDETIADFFCGLGNFSLPLARHAKHVVGYEIGTAMVKRATANASGFVNLEFRAADLYAGDAAIADVRISDGYAAALLDPPRAGAKALCERLSPIKTLRRIVYVSCNPQTLIRDIDILVRGGFSVHRAALVDMFPHTGHIEAIVSLQRDA